MGAAISSKHKPRPHVSRQSEPRAPESAETKNGGIGLVYGEREIFENQGQREVPAIAHEQVPILEVAETSSKWDNNKRVEEARKARLEWLQRLRRECTTEEEFETARSQPIWAQLSSTSCASSRAPSRPSPAALQRIREKNRLHFQHLVDKRPSHSKSPAFDTLRKLSPFYVDFGGKMEAGQKIGGGGQADIHEAIYNGRVDNSLVLKVSRSDHLLADLQRTWTRGIVSPEMGSSYFGNRKNCCGIIHGTLLQDGRFAFILQRCWGDLWKAIDLEIVKWKAHNTPPFANSERIMFEIAQGMKELHERGICHRDLKAANCLLLQSPEVCYYNRNTYLVADYESCEGVMGTRFWRAPEILLVLKNKNRDINSTQEVWSKKADVYSYAMTCYEISTGCIPFEDRASNDYDGVIGGDRPPLPDYVNPELQKLIKWCWDSEPSRRPTFPDILHYLDIHFSYSEFEVT